MSNTTIGIPTSAYRVVPSVPYNPAEYAWSISAPVWRVWGGWKRHRRRIFSHGHLAPYTLCRPLHEPKLWHEEPIGKTKYAVCQECERRAARE